MFHNTRLLHPGIGPYGGGVTLSPPTFKDVKGNVQFGDKALGRDAVGFAHVVDADGSPIALAHELQALDGDAVDGGSARGGKAQITVDYRLFQTAAGVIGPCIVDVADMGASARIGPQNGDGGIVGVGAQSLVVAGGHVEDAAVRFVDLSAQVDQGVKTLDLPLHQTDTCAVPKGHGANGVSNIVVHVKFQGIGGGGKGFFVDIHRKNLGVGFKVQRRSAAGQIGDRTVLAQGTGGIAVQSTSVKVQSHRGSILRHRYLIGALCKIVVDSARHLQNGLVCPRIANGGFDGVVQGAGGGVKADFKDVGGVFQFHGIGAKCACRVIDLIGQAAVTGDGIGILAAVREIGVDAGVFVVFSVFDHGVGPIVAIGHVGKVVRGGNTLGAFLHTHQFQYVHKGGVGKNMVNGTVCVTDQMVGKAQATFNISMGRGTHTA